MMTFQEASQWLLARDNFIILTHRSPDGDTIGSSVGLCLALREQGKTAFLLKNDEISDTFLPYTADLQSSDFQADYVVSVDVASQQLFPDLAEQYKGKVDLAIDHHPITELFGKENCIYPEKAAAGELIYEIISLWGPVSKAAAMPLYIALATDTGCFVYGNTTADTHKIAGFLMRTGLEVRDLNKTLFQTTTLKRLKLEGKLVSTMRLFDGGSVAIVCVTQAILKELQATKHDTENISAFVGKIEGVTSGITISEKSDGFCKISMRSNPSILKANEVCAKLGGGGHAAASGAKIKSSVEDAVLAVVQAIQEVQGKKLTPFL